MANKKLTDLTELTTPADNDFLYIVDVSDTTESAQGTSKKIRKDKVDSGASKENIANKQNSLAIDGTGTKYPTVDAVNAVLPTTYSKVVYVNATSPTTATIFDTENPPVTNDNALKNDTANLYIGTDASTWVYLTGTGYVTKTVSSATSNFNTFGTTIDAGNSKTSHITRSGAVTLTGSLNLAIAKISTVPNTSAGSYDILTRNSSTTALEKKLVSDFVQTTTTQYISGRKNFNSDNTTTGGITIISSRTTNTPGTSDSSALTINNTGGNAILIETGTGDGILAKALSSGSAITAQTFSTGAGLTLRNQGGTGDLLSAELGKVTISSAGKLSTTELATTGNNVPNKTYVDSKITQTITNGVTDKSPSEDAVFDALALKVSGSGTNNYVPKFTASGTVGNSQIFDNGTNVGIGTGTPTAKLSIKSTSYPVLDITRDSGISGDAIFGVARFERLTTTPTTDGGLGFFFNYPNSASQSTFCGVFGGYLSDITAGAEVGNVVFAASWRNVSPATNKHLIIRATGTSTGNVLVPNGKLLVATSIDDGITTNVVQVNGNIKATQFRISNLNTAPASATDTGTLGEVRITATHIYVCTATNTWVRTALATW